jgi:hypothetical protein
MPRARLTRVFSDVGATGWCADGAQPRTPRRWRCLTALTYRRIFYRSEAHTRRGTSVTCRRRCDKWTRFSGSLRAGWIDAPVSRRYVCLGIYAAGELG